MVVRESGEGLGWDWGDSRGCWEVVGASSVLDPEDCRLWFRSNGKPVKDFKWD